jgi:hypothetical protein
MKTQTECTLVEKLNLLTEILLIKLENKNMAKAILLMVRPQKLMYLLGLIHLFMGHVTLLKQKKHLKNI